MFNFRYRLKKYKLLTFFKLLCLSENDFFEYSPVSNCRGRGCKKGDLTFSEKISKWGR